MLKRIKIIGWLFIIAVFVIDGCRKDTIVVIPLKPVVITKAVSFKNDLVPIFAKNCALSGCHAEGAHNPTLTLGLAYKSLMSDPGLIDKVKPENSEVYERLIGKLSPSMPMGGAPNPSNIEGLLLAWIKQGAKNN